MSSLINVSVYGTTYQDKDSAKADYEVKKLLRSAFGLMHTFSAAIIQKGKKW